MRKKQSADIVIALHQYCLERIDYATRGTTGDDATIRAGVNVKRYTRAREKERKKRGEKGRDV